MGCWGLKLFQLPEGKCSAHCTVFVALKKQILLTRCCFCC